MVQKKKVLIIDSNLITSRLSADMLKDAGMKTEIVPSVSQAFYKIKETAFDLILTDLFIDLFDSIRMFTRISSANIVILTNHCEEKLLRQARDNGASGYIIKSHVPSDEFVRLIRQSVV